MKTLHLTEEEFTDLAIGERLSDTSRSHLAACEACRQQSSVFGESVELFNTTSLAWSEARPSVSLRATASRRTARMFYAPVGWALAAAALLTVGFPAWHRASQQAPLQTAAVTAQEDSPAEIAQDNALMLSVNVALNETEASPFQEYRLPDTRARARSR